MKFGIGYNSTSRLGVLGVGYALNEARSPSDGASFKPYRNLPQLMVDQGLIRSNAYSLWLDDLKSSTGIILFGAVDTGQFHGTLQTLPILKTRGGYSAFRISMTGLSLSGGLSFHHDLPNVALLDSGSSLTFLPRQLVNDIYSTLGIHYDDDSEQTPAVDCSLATDKRSIEFTFNSTKISVPMSELVLPTSSSRCNFGIAPTGGLPLLGDTFLRSAYVVYDLANNQIHMAQTNFGATKSHIMEIGPESRPAQAPATLVGSVHLQGNTSVHCANVATVSRPMGLWTVVAIACVAATLTSA